MVGEDLVYRMDPKKFRVTSGDVSSGYWQLNGYVMEKCADLLKEPDKSNCLNLDKSIDKIIVLTIDENNRTKDLIGIGVGAFTGLRFFGPIGAIGGAIAGSAIASNKHDVTLEVHLVDGQQFEAQMSKGMYKRFEAIAARHREPEVSK